MSAMDTIKGKAACPVGAMVLVRMDLFDQSESVFFPDLHDMLYRNVLDDPLRRRISPMISNNLEESFYVQS